MNLLWAVSALLLSCWRANASTAGFIKSPLSQMKLISDSAELHCEVVGNPIPEVQWWFIQGEEPNETFTQLFDGAHDDRVLINATYIAHATSTLHISSLNLNDSGTYECRASNDPDRNDLKKTPKIKWIRSQANIIVIEREWQRKHEETPVKVSLAVLSSLLKSWTFSSCSTPKPPSSTPKPPSSTPKPPSSTPNPPSSTPKPPSSTPKPPGSTPKPPGSTPKPPGSIPSPTRNTLSLYSPGHKVEHVQVAPAGILFHVSNNDDDLIFLKTNKKGVSDFLIGISSS